MSKRCAFIFGQFGQAADPVNLPHLRDRVAMAGFGTILVQHDDSQAVYNFLHGFDGFKATIGSSLGAMSAVIFAGDIGQEVDFVGGFQPSDWDPNGHNVSIQSGSDLITRAITVPGNVRNALCFRNPIVAATGGLGHATYVLDSGNNLTKLQVLERNDMHPGDFGEAADIMYYTLVGLAKDV